MNLLLLAADDRWDGGWRVTGHRARHLIEVLKVEPGRSLRVGWIDGPVGTGTVVSVEPGAVQLTATAKAAAPAPGLSLVLAVPRPKMLKKLLPGVAAFGLRQLWLLRAWRTQPVYFRSPVLQPDSIRALLLDGMSQGRWTQLPRVHRVERFETFFEGPLPDGNRWVADPGAARDLCELDRVDGPVCVAIGPEGGWLPYEVSRFEASGFLPVRSGEAVLRTDVASVTLLAQADLLVRRSKLHGIGASPGPESKAPSPLC